MTDTGTEKNSESLKPVYIAFALLVVYYLHELIQLCISTIH